MKKWFIYVCLFLIGIAITIRDMYKEAMEELYGPDKDENEEEDF